MTSVNTHTKRIIAALALGCFFIMACENDVNEVKNLSVRKTGIEEGRNIVSYFSVGENESEINSTSPASLPRR